MDGSNGFGRREFLRSGLALAILSQIERGLLGMQNDSEAMNELARQLHRGRTAFFSQPFSFSWWLRGGEPGSPSDKLTLEGSRGAVNGTYIRARFDPARQPPTYSEAFKGAVDEDRAADLLRPLFESRLFREAYKEESDRQMKDLQKETWTFSRRDAGYTKTFFEPLPESLENLRAICRTIEQQLSHETVR